MTQCDKEAASSNFVLACLDSRKQGPPLPNAAGSRALGRKSVVQHDAVPVRHRLHSHSFSNCGRQRFSTVARYCSQNVISTSPVPPAVPFRAGGAVPLCWCSIRPLARKVSAKPESSKCRTLLILVWVGVFPFTTPDRAVPIPYTEPGLARRWRIYHDEH